MRSYFFTLGLRPGRWCAKCFSLIVHQELYQGELASLLGNLTNRLLNDNVWRTAFCKNYKQKQINGVLQNNYYNNFALYLLPACTSLASITLVIYICLTTACAHSSGAFLFLCFQQLIKYELLLTALCSNKQSLATDFQSMEALL